MGHATLMLLAALLLSSAAVSQETAEAAPDWQLRLVRVRYDSSGGMREAYYIYDGRLWERWETDFPAADRNFMKRIAELTRVRVHPEPKTLTLTRPELFDFPLLYMSDVGWMRLSWEEKLALREYLQRGGFLWIDDFWGEAEWSNLERVMIDVLPDVPWRTIEADHPLLHTVFDLPGVPQVPARDFAIEGSSDTADPPSIHRFPAGSLKQVNFRAWIDDKGRLMAIATHNSDIGDGWEREAYGQWFFETFSTRAYGFGVNALIYALTH